LNEKFEMSCDDILTKITKNTICIVASLPEKTFGVCDNIESIAEIALKMNVPLHVDAGLGGLLLAHLDDEKKNMKCDFTLKGVTSISVEYHKFGLSPLGLSVLMFKNRRIRKCHYFIYNKWSGGIYPCSGLPGSRTPATVLAAYSILLSVGNN
jgi:sphinganine-1-phosphate aldolase